MLLALTGKLDSRGVASAAGADAASDSRRL
jgi:hypothetical protein